MVKIKLLREFTKGIVEGMKTFGELISNLVNSLLMLTVYFLVVGPTAILAKITRKSFLEIKSAGWNNIKKRDNYSHHKQF